jgi:hypothetical protein
MKLSDKCWRLNRTEGVSESTVSECTRGDSTCTEFFGSEKEAWAAEAERIEWDWVRAISALSRTAERLTEARRKAGLAS